MGFAWTQNSPHWRRYLIPQTEAGLRAPTEWCQDVMTIRQTWGELSHWTSNLWQLKESISIYQYLTLQYIFGGWLLEPKLNLAKKKCHALKWEKNREEAIGSFKKFFVHILFCSGVPQFSKNGVGFLAFAGRWDLPSVSVHHGCKHAAVQEQSGIGTERLNLQARLQIEFQVPQVVRSGTDVWEQQEEALQKMIKDYAREAGQCGCEESC